MASRGQKQPFGLVKDRELFLPDAAFWTDVETAFESNFSVEQKEALEKIIDRYFREVQLEQNAEAMKESEKLAGEIEKATSKLLFLLSTSERDNTSAYCLELLEYQVTKSLGSGEGLNDVRSLLRVVRQASQDTLNSMQSEPVGAFRPGSAWSELVRNLTGFAEVNGLSSAARNEAGAGDTSTPFTEFVFTIQNSACFPKSLAAHMQSKGALGKAITRARK